MIIEDEELRDIFKTASEDHLQKLDDGLLYLEKHPDDQAKLEELLREAHSLKGDAGMLGVKDVATLSHQIEHILGSVKRGETILDRTISDRIYHGLDAIRQLVREAVTGEPPQVNTFYVLARMMGSEEKGEGEGANGRAGERESGRAEEPENRRAGEPESGRTGERENDIKVENVHINSPTPPLPHSPTPPLQVSPISITQSPAQKEQSYRQNPSASRFSIESVRVETRHLDSLMTQAGELTVTKIRIAHRLSEMEELVNLCEEGRREANINRFVVGEVDTFSSVSIAKGASNGKKTSPSSSLYVGDRGERENGRWAGEKFPSPSPSSLSLSPHFHHRIQQRLEQLGSLANRLRNAMYEDNARLEIIADELSEGIRTLRLLPLANIFNLFPRMVRDLAKQENKQVELVIEGAETKADKRILEEMKDPLMHMIRNAIDHGIETPEERQHQGKPLQAKIQLKAKQTATNVVIEVVDDGRGLDIDKIKQTAVKRGVCRPEELANMTKAQIQSLIFEPGFSTRTFVTEVSGRGVGLDVVRTNVELLKGTIQVESEPGNGCTIRLQLPTTLATAHVLIVAVMGISYAIPVEFVQMARFILPDDIFTIEGRDTIILDNQPVSIARLANLLELGNRGWGDGAMAHNNSQSPIPNPQSPIPCIILKVADDRLGLLIDALVDEQDVMLKPQTQLLKRVRNVSGATILGTGEVCIILNCQDLIKSVRKQVVSATPKQTPQTPTRKQTILLAEDSISTRTQEKRILEAAGYEVVTAVDGLDALNKLNTRSFDAVVSDVQMPNLDGLGLTAKIRQHKEYSELPIILVTSLASDEDKRRGAEAGANAYITKGTFSQEVLIDTLRRLV